MKKNCTIYYFSGSGNSLYLAKELQKKLELSECISIANAITENAISNKNKIIGFIFPTYTMGPPKIVTSFIKKLNLEQSEYIFAISNMGGNAGITINLVEKLLKKKNKRLNLGRSIAMGANTNLFMNIPGTSPILNEHERAVAFENAQIQISEIAHAIMNEKKQSLQKKPFIKSLLMSLIYNAYIKSVNRFDNNFFTTKECTSCGTCQKVCPVSNIKLDDRAPQWQNNCQSCLACFNYCPAHAITHKYAKNEKMTKQYRHPQIKMNEIAGQ